MSVFTSIGIIVFSMLILASLQLVPGIFMILRHFSSGKFSQNRASDLATFFILGVETATVLVFFLLYLISSTPLLASSLHSQAFAWFIACVLIIIAFAFPLCYFGKGTGTRLFISRRLSSNYRRCITATKSRSDAFTLGLTAILPELIFTLPLYLLSITELTSITSDPLTQAFLIVIFAIIVILPLLILHGLFRSHTLADFLRFRFKNKTFFRFFPSLLYLLLAVLIILRILL